MKNKLYYSILALIANFYFINTASCQSVNTDCYPTSNNETQIIEPSCEVNDNYRYFTLGVGPIILIPNIGIGFRERFSQFGWDAAASFSTIGYAHQLEAHFVGHYYLSPYRQNSAYMGLGLMGSGIFTNQKDGGFTLSPDFVFGKEFKIKDESRQFIEMHVAIPSLWIESMHTHAFYYPLMYIKYGLSF